MGLRNFKIVEKAKHFLGVAYPKGAEDAFPEYLLEDFTEMQREVGINILSSMSFDEVMVITKGELFRQVVRKQMYLKAHG